MTGEDTADEVGGDATGASVKVPLSDLKRRLLALAGRAESHRLVAPHGVETARHRLTTVSTARLLFPPFDGYIIHCQAGTALVEPRH